MDKTTAPICTIEGCKTEAKRAKRTLCHKHYSRIKRHGSSDIVLPRPRPRGHDNPNYKGDAITVKAAHMRVRAERGPASDHQCIDCAGQAAHWSYDHQDPNEQLSEKHGPYSAKTEHYHPRCVPCHKRFDLALRA